MNDGSTPTVPDAAGAEDATDSAKATPAMTRVARARAWAERLSGPGGTAMFFAKRMGQDDIANTAASLCYSTALAVVPALALILGTMSAFPAFTRLRVEVEDALVSNFMPDTGLKVQEQLSTFVAAAGKLTAFGILGLAVTSILLLLTIEKAFGRIFRVTHPRPLFLRLMVLWAVLTIGPFLIGTSLSLFGYFTSSAEDGSLLATIVFGHVLPTALTWFAITLLYKSVPNRRVRFEDAAIGGAVTAILFEVLRLGFAVYVKGSTYSAIYGAVAAVPVFLLWIYLIWIVVMAGAVIAAALPDWRLLRRGLGSGPGVKLALALAVIDQLAQAFRRGQGMSPEALGRATAVPEAAVLRVLDDLQRFRFVTATDHGLWVLARDLSTAPLHELVHHFGFGIGPAAAELSNTELGRRVCPHLDPAASSERELLSVSIAEVIGLDGPAHRPGPVRARGAA